MLCDHHIARANAAITAAELAAQPASEPQQPLTFEESEMRAAHNIRSNT